MKRDREQDKMRLSASRLALFEMKQDLLNTCDSMRSNEIEQDALHLALYSRWNKRDRTRQMRWVSLYSRDETSIEFSCERYLSPKARTHAHSFHFSGLVIYYSNGDSGDLYKMWPSLLSPLQAGSPHFPVLFILPRSLRREIFFVVFQRKHSKSWYPPQDLYCFCVADRCCPVYPFTHWMK